MSESPGPSSPNPYQANLPPAGYPPSADPKPTSVTVLGILNIALGCLGLCGTMVAVAMFFLPVNANNDLPAMKLMQDDVYQLYSTISLGLGFLATAVLIYAGIALLKGQPLGRTLSIGYAYYGIVSVVIGLIVNYVLIVGPTLEQFADQPMSPAKSGAIGGAVGGFVGGCIGIVYPIVLLFFMMRSNVKAYFQSP